MKSMGKLLISGSGNGHKAIATSWISSIVTSVIFAVVFYVMANKFGYDNSYGWSGYERMGIPKYGVTGVVRNDVYYFFMVLMAIFSVGPLVTAYLSHIGISKTGIDVYDDGIEGSGYNSMFSIHMSEFKLTYNQISTVEVLNGNMLVINAEGTKDTIYVMNAREIRDTILEQKSKIG